MVEAGATAKRSVGRAVPEARPLTPSTRGVK